MPRSMKLPIVDHIDATLPFFLASVGFFAGEAFETVAPVLAGFCLFWEDSEITASECRDADACCIASPFSGDTGRLSDASDGETISLAAIFSRSLLTLVVTVG